MPTTSDQTSNKTAPIRFIVDEPGIDTELGIKGRGYSPDNGQTFFVQDTTDGRVYRVTDAKRLFPLLKPMFDQVYTSGPVETSLHWADILDKPDLITKQQLDDRLTAFTPAVSWDQVTGKPDLSNYYTKTETDAKLSTKADKSSLSGLATRTAVQQAQSTAQEAQSTANSANSTAESAYSLASSANSKASQLESKINQIGKIDSSSQYTNKTPSQYSDGVFYEVKNSNYIGIDRSDMDPSAQTGSTALVTTKKYGSMARQTAEILDNQRPITFIRNGYSSSWSTWEAVTTW